MNTLRYKTPAAFKVALEDRLKRRAAQRGVMLNRVRQRFVMERFLARVVEVLGPVATLKGGIALELRLANARSTKDIDLRVVGDPERVLARLQEAAALAPGDHLVFRVEPNAEHPIIEAGVYEGRRFSVAVTLAGQVYGTRFGVDVGIADPIHDTPDELIGEDYLDFVGIGPVRVAAYPVETHIAEKLHAYTQPPLRPGRENSRVRDLPDLGLLAGTRALTAQEIRAALVKTFSFRGSHSVPENVPAPPESWAPRYVALAEENGLPWATLAEAHAEVVAFLGPVLSGTEGTWDPRERRWTTG